MPINYNIPNWYSEEYREAMVKLLGAIRHRFHTISFADSGYLRDLTVRRLPESLSLRDFLASNHEPIWSGPDRNLGWNVIWNKHKDVFQRILPSYMIASIEIHEAGYSEAEESDMPKLLAERLTPPSCLGWRWPSNVPPEFSGCDMGQMQTIRSVLDLIAFRKDAAGEKARIALDRFWQEIPPLTGRLHARGTSGK